MPIKQTDVMAEVACANRNFCFVLLASRFDIVVARAKTDAVGTCDQMFIALRRRDRRAICIDDDVAGIVELGRGIRLLPPASIELRLAAQEPDDRLIPSGAKADSRGIPKAPKV